MERGNNQKQIEIERKRNRLTTMEEELANINKVIEYIYYYGNKI
jgi:hypothetical protein